MDSLADALDTGVGRRRYADSSALAEEVNKAHEALTTGKRLLDELKSETTLLESSQPRSARLTALRAQYSRLSRAFIEAARAHQAAKERMRAVEVNALVEEAVRTGGGTGIDNADDLRREAARDPAGFARRQAQAQILKQQTEPSVGAAQAYDEAAARAEEVGLLVRSILEVQELFRDIATLVSHQAEDVGNVESHVERAAIHVVKANDQLLSAARKRRYRRNCCIGLAVTGLILTVLGVIALSMFITGAYKAIIP